MLARIVRLSCVVAALTLAVLTVLHGTPPVQATPQDTYTLDAVTLTASDGSAKRKYRNCLP